MCKFQKQERENLEFIVGEDDTKYSRNRLFYSLFPLPKPLRLPNFSTRSKHSTRGTSKTTQLIPTRGASSLLWIVSEKTQPHSG